MKLTIKNLIARMANSKATWPLFGALRKLERGLDALCTYAERQKRAGAPRDLKTKILAERFPDLVVKSGAFAGLRYPDAAATGSALLPKLAGSYENELADALATIRTRDYTQIFDIGCAEGYYAVGLAQLFPDAEVLAFDVDEDARAMCSRMANVNGVADRVQVLGFCDPDKLRELEHVERSLIFADCEGYESELFSADTAPALAKHDIIIECHDYKDPTISPRIVEAFAQTHDIDVTRAVSEREKAMNPDLPALEGYNVETCRFIVSEARYPAQFWLFLSSKSGARSVFMPSEPLPDRQSPNELDQGVA